MARQSRVSIGLPVYNAEKFVASAIEAHLSQSFGEFELIVSDNASTDGTVEICRWYAARDDRIKLVHTEVNRGLNWNHLRVFQLAECELFRWASADDVPDPGLIEACVRELDRDPDIIGCMPTTQNVDALGRDIETRPTTLELNSNSARERANSVLGGRYQMTFVQGLFRREALVLTNMGWNFVGYDFILLLELALRGRIATLENAVLRRRVHDGQATLRLHRAATMREFEPDMRAITAFPHWRWALERVRACVTAPLPISERGLIAWQVMRHEWWNRRAFAKDISRALSIALRRSDQTAYRL